jgi:outer membrane protein OmpA-like peptidoglycan-associated protein
VLAGCAGTEAGRDVNGFNREAGALVDTGYFGNATMNNHQYMTGQKHYVYDLSKRFAAEVPSMVTFAFNSSVLDQAAINALAVQASWIRQFPEVRFRVYGHADKVGSEAYNRALGMRRANAVVDFLVGQGISRARLEAVVSFGETQPLVVTEGRERRNRRTVTEVSGFVSGHPTILDGKYAEVIYREYIVSAEPVTGLTTQSGSELAVTQ